MSTKNTSRTLKYIITTISLSVLVLVLLVMLTSNPRMNKGGFKRIILIPTAKIKETFQMKGTQILDLCGNTESNFFFYTSHFSTILVTDKHLAQGKYIDLYIDSTMRKLLQDTLLFTTRIDYPEVTIFFQNSASILRCRLNDKIQSLFQVKSKYNNSLSLSPSSVLIQRFDSLGNNLLFSKINLLTNEYIDETNITERLNDGGFSTDGKISLDKTSGNAIYTYYYCNKVYLFDSNLNIKTCYRTIDTFDHYQAKADHFGKNKHRGYTFERPPKPVNDWSVVYNNKIYVNSQVISDNENERSFIDNSVIDIYDVSSGRYISSFYIPRFNGNKLWRFEINNCQLFVFYQNAIAEYSLPDLPPNG